jgi:lysyl-tRNA synthetase class 2
LLRLDQNQKRAPDVIPRERAAMLSSVIADFDYDFERAVLSIEFVSGRIYEYYDVPSDVAADFQSAPSKGTFFNVFIRDRYNFREVTSARN